ncbi:MAG: insulinase family protein, partial [Spirochaetia bacterium]
MLQNNRKIPRLVAASLFTVVATLILALSGCVGQAPAAEELVVQPVTATAEPSTEAEIPVDPQVRLGRLENGLTYYVRPNRKPENRAELRLVVNAGSVLEDEDQLGLAHFLEHMAFNGTEHFEKHELIEFMESIGMRLGPDVNAYTSFDETV